MAVRRSRRAHCANSASGTFERSSGKRPRSSDDRRAAGAASRSVFDPGREAFVDLDDPRDRSSQANAFPQGEAGVAAQAVSRRSQGCRLGDGGQPRAPGPGSLRNIRYEAASRRASARFRGRLQRAVLIICPQKAIFWRLSALNCFGRATVERNRTAGGRRSRGRDAFDECCAALQLVRRSCQPYRF